jgi:hypothetical protein
MKTPCYKRGEDRGCFAFVSREKENPNKIVILIPKKGGFNYIKGCLQNVISKTRPYTSITPPPFL